MDVNITPEGDKFVFSVNGVKTVLSQEEAVTVSGEIRAHTVAWTEETLAWIVSDDEEYYTTVPPEKQYELTLIAGVFTIDEMCFLNAHINQYVLGEQDAVAQYVKTHEEANRLMEEDVFNL